MTAPIAEFEKVAVEFFTSWIELEIQLIRKNLTREQINEAKFFWNLAGMRLAQLLIEHNGSFEAHNALVCHIGVQLAIDGRWTEASEVCKFSVRDPAQG